MNEIQLNARLKELDGEADVLLKEYAAEKIGRKQFVPAANRINAEADSIKSALKNLKAGKQAFAAAEEAMGGALLPNTPDYSAFSSATVKHQALLREFGLTPAALPEPGDITGEQLRQVYEMSRNKVPGSVEVRPNSRSVKSLGWRGDVMTKAAGGPALESGIAGAPFSGQLPPIQTMFAVGKAYEPTAISALLPGAAMPGPSSTFMTHTANTNEATGVPENTAKPSLGPSFSETQVVPELLAATVEYSLQALQDTERFGEASFAAFLPHELTSSLINSTNLALLTASTQATNPLGASYPVSYAFNGWLNQAGTLGRALVTGATNIDTLRLAINDLRVGAAFADADLIVMSPTTWTHTRGEQDSNKRYQMDLLAAPLSLSAYGEPRIAAPASDPVPYSATPPGVPGLSGQLWGCPVAVTTMVPDGTAIVASIARGAGVYFVRQTMRIEWNMWAENLWTNNLMSYRAENRISFACLRPSAVNIVTGLGAS